MLWCAIISSFSAKKIYPYDEGETAEIVKFVLLLVV